MEDSEVSTGIDSLVSSLLQDNSEESDIAIVGVMNKNKKSGIRPNLSKLTAPVYGFFNWNDEKAVWCCKLCRCEYTHHEHSGSATLNKHMQMKHNKSTKDLMAERLSTVEATQLKISSHVVPVKPPPQPVTQVGFMDRLINFIIATDQPFSIVENEEFRELIKFPRNNENIKMPKRKSVKKSIHEKFVQERDKLRTELHQSDAKISLMIDCWTSKNQHPYQGVVVSWIDKAWKMNTTILDLTLLDGAHTGENIAKELDATITDFDLWQKLISITTDNASNMDTMFEKLDEIAQEKGADFTSKNGRVRCLAHIVNLSCKAILSKADGLTSEEMAVTDSSDCNESIDGNAENPGGIISLIRKAAGAIRASPQRRTQLKNNCAKGNVKYRNLILDMRIRWSTTLDMLVRAMEVKVPLQETLQNNPKLANFTLTEAQWIVVEQLIQLLKPFKEATIRISNERPTLSDTTGAYQILFEHLEAYIENEPHAKEPLPKRRRNERLYPEWLTQCAQAGWEKLRQYYSTADSMICVAATVMDPRLKLDWYKALEWTSESQVNAKKLINKLWSSSYKCCTRESQKPPTTAEEESPSSSSRSRICESEDLFKSLFTDKMKKFQTTDDELKRYLSEPVEEAEDGALQWWMENSKRFSKTSKMAKDVMSAHGTGVSVEKFFSSGPDLLSHRRQRLSAQSIRECLTLKCWLRQKKRPNAETEFVGESFIFKILGDTSSETQDVNSDQDEENGEQNIK